MDLNDVRVARARAAVRDVHRAGEILLGEAQRRAPIEEGTLRGSGALAIVVSGQRFEGTGALAGATALAEGLARAHSPITVTAEVSFNTVYAARQHEELDWRHPKGVQAKYLEQPLGELAPRLEAMIAAGQATAT